MNEVPRVFIVNESVFLYNEGVAEEVCVLPTFLKKGGKNGGECAKA